MTIQFLPESVVLPPHFLSILSEDQTCRLRLTCGTMIMVWLGEQITQKGIGNGISLLITVSIISGLPGAVAAAYQMFVAPVGSEGTSLGVPEGVLMLALLFTVTAPQCAYH